MWWKIAGILGATGVGAAAFGAHALRGLDPELLEVWQTAARLHLIHAVALLGVAAHPGRPRVAGWLFTAGVVLFSGSLYALALTGIRGLGAITPIGGLGLIAGWIALALAAVPGGSAPREPG